MPLVVFGLGNPGKKYEGTLHNAGFEATNRMAALLGGKPSRRCLRRFRTFRVSSDASGLADDVLLIQPLTYMNNSGAVVRGFCYSDATVVIVCDNMDLALGTVRIRKVQSLSAHKGLRSIQENFRLLESRRPDCSVELIAVYIGIGRPPEGVSVVSHVLGRPDSDEGVRLFQSAAETAARALMHLAQGRSLQEVQLEFNHRQSGY
ncbi:MAG: aminoacyl-tRNA hydrolase [Sphaerochaetaceae bacterium]